METEVETIARGGSSKSFEENFAASSQQSKTDELPQGPRNLNIHSLRRNISRGTSQPQVEPWTFGGVLYTLDKLGLSFHFF